MANKTKDKFNNLYYDTKQIIADKVQFNNKNNCPICGNENVSLGSMELMDMQAYCPCYCCNCGADWVKWYDLTFIGNDSIKIN